MMRLSLILTKSAIEVSRNTMDLITGNKYKWKYEPQALVYIGIKNGWYQFTLNNSLWCEVLESDLKLMEEVL